MPKRKQRKPYKKSRQSHAASPIKRPSYVISKSQQSTLYYFAGGFALIFLFCAFFIYLPTIRTTLGFPDNSIDPAALRGYRARLRRLYEKYNPNKLDEIDEILEKYRGKEKQLFKKLHNKYVKPNKKVREKERKERRAKKKRMRDGVDDDNRIPDDETEEEASARRRRKKERDRQKRKEARKKDRGGKDYYDDWDDDDAKKNYGEYFSDDEELFGFGNDARFEGEIDLMDDDDEE